MNDEDRKAWDESFRAVLQAKYGDVWNTTEMQEAFTVLGFAAGYCVVERKSDGERGSLDFTHSPRFYHSFTKG